MAAGPAHEFLHSLLHVWQFLALSGKDSSGHEAMQVLPSFTLAQALHMAGPAPSVEHENGASMHARIHRNIHINIHVYV